MTHCNNIRRFSEAVYEFLTEVFDYRLSFSEIGLTDHLLLELARHSRITRDRSIEIYKMPWTVESIYGNDIDLFIQNSAGTYNWYALQAKVMSFNGAFKDLKFNTRATTQQWDKLLLHETKFGSKTYYLLYCGKSLRPPTDLPVRTDCIGVPPIEELGLGIVETNVIQRIRTVDINHSQLFYFRHVFPNEIDSIRKLFCCSGNLTPTTKQFKKVDIETRGYQKIYFMDDNVTKIDNDVNIELNDGNAPIRIIINSNESNASC